MKSDLSEHKGTAQAYYSKKILNLIVNQQIQEFNPEASARN